MKTSPMNINDKLDEMSVAFGHSLLGDEALKLIKALRVACGAHQFYADNGGFRSRKALAEIESILK